jgi:long-chain acyl-CoA synthetase
MKNDMNTPKIPFEIGDDIPSAFRKIAAERPDDLALIFKERRITWSQLDERVCRIANALLAKGIKKGDRVAILSQNSVEYVELIMGSVTAGACVVPLPTMSSSAALGLMMEDSEAKLIAVSEAMRELADSFLNRNPQLGSKLRIGLDFNDPSWSSVTTFLEGVSSDLPEVALRGGDDFNVIYSSGTTGSPKGIVHTHAIRKAFTDTFVLFAGGTGLISTPFYSNITMASILPALRFGTTCVVMEKFDAEELLRLVEKEKVNFMTMVPVQYDRILKVESFDQFDLSSLFIMLCMGAPLSLELKKKIIEKFPGEFVEGYGITEGGAATSLMTSQFPDKLASVGQPVAGCEVKIIDDKGKELPAGEIGEIVGRQLVMSAGYQNLPEENREMLWHDSEEQTFYRTGDTGHLDEDNFLFLSDRKKDMIISGGLNIYPSDIEKVLNQNEEIHEATVIGIPSEKWGETPLAFVVLEQGSHCTAAEILEWANSRLGKSQRIAEVVLRDDLPRSEVGKIQKKELRKAYWDQV